MSFERVLLVDLTWAPISVISWMKAICLLYQEKVQPLEFQEAKAHSPSITLQVPSVIKLNCVVKAAWQAVRFSRRHVYYRDGYCCQYCGKTFSPTKLNLDHVIPRSRGGQTTWENVVTCCINHNRIKGGRMPREAGMKLLRRPGRPSWSPGEKIVASYTGPLPKKWFPYLSLKEDVVKRILKARA